MPSIRWIALLFVLSVGAACGDGLETPDDISSTAAYLTAEPGWIEVLKVEPGDAIAAKFNPVDGALYYGGRSSVSARRGLWRVAADGTVAKVGGNTQVGGVVVDPASGDVFYSDDFSGRVFRSAGGTATPANWVTGFARGDDDPVGMAVAPADHTSGILAPGEMAVVDRGSGGLDQIWAFSPASAEGERLIHPDNGTLNDGVDLAITRDAVYVADQGASTIYRLLADGTLEAVAGPPMRPASLAVDPLTQDLFVMDLDSSSVLRFNPLTGDASVVLSELEVNTDNFASLDVSQDGLRLVVTERGVPGNGTITVFEFVPNEPPVAVCENIVVEIGAEACDADATLGSGSFDPDGDPIDVELSNPGPYPIGDTSVTVTVTDSEGASSSCESVVSVVPTAQAWVAENAVSDRGDFGMLAFGFFGGGLAVFDVESAVFEAAVDNSSARLSGTMRVRRDGAFGFRNGELWTVDLAFEQAPDSTRPVGVPGDSAEAADWRLFRVASGSSMSRVDGGTVVEMRPLPRFLPFAFQLGDGANRKNDNFGLSGTSIFKRTIWRRFAFFGPAKFSLDLTPVCAVDDEPLAGL